MRRRWRRLAGEQQRASPALAVPAQRAEAHPTGGQPLCVIVPFAWTVLGGDRRVGRVEHIAPNPRSGDAVQVGAAGRQLGEGGCGRRRPWQRRCTGWRGRRRRRPRRRKQRRRLRRRRAGGHERRWLRRRRAGQWTSWRRVGCIHLYPGAAPSVGFSLAQPSSAGSLRVGAIEGLTVAEAGDVLGAASAHERGERALTQYGAARTLS